MCSGPAPRGARLLDIQELGELACVALGVVPVTVV